MPGRDLRHADTVLGFRRSEDIHKTEAESAAWVGYVVKLLVVHCKVLTASTR
jgi:hypothetical protein